MVVKLLSNIKNKFRRVTNQLSFKRKSKEQHKQFHQEKDLSSNDKSNRKPLWFLSWFKISPKFIFSLLIIGIVGLFLYQVVLLVEALVGFQTKPYTGYSQIPVVREQVKYEWQGDTKITIVIVGTDKVDVDHVFVDALGIYNVDPVEKKLSVFMINPDLRVYVSAVGREVNFRTVFTDPNLSGDRAVILKNAVAALLAIRVDRYIVVDKADFAKYTTAMNPVKVNVKQDISDPDTLVLSGSKIAEWKKGEQSIRGDSFLEFLASDINGRNDQLERQQSFFASLPFEQISLGTVLNLPQLINKFSDYFYTDLSKNELFTLIPKALDIKEDNLKRGYTHAASYQKVNTTSFYTIYIPILERIDQDINNIFFDLKIFKEQARIEVLNSSNVKGLANSRARWIANLGARIIKVGNGLGGLEKTKIYCAEPDKYIYTINELNRVFNFKAELIKQEYPNRHMGDIIIELGNTYE